MCFLVMLLQSCKSALKANIKPISRYYSSKMKEQIINIDRYKINYVKAGHGAHTLLLLPGALVTIQTSFKPQLEGLDKTKYTLVAWDPPGYGKSRPPERDFPSDYLHRDAQLAGKFMEKLGFEKYSVLGWSDGGKTGLILADTRKNNIKKVITFATNSYLSEADMKISKGIKDVSTWSERMRRPMEEIYGKEYLTILVSAWFDAVLYFRQKNGGDICKTHLKNITAPTLVLHGDNDRVVRVEHATFLYENIPNAKLHIFKDGSHDLHLRCPEQFNSLIDRFLSS